MNLEFQFLSKYPILCQKLKSADDLAAGHPDESLGASRVFAELLLNEIGQKHGAPRNRERGSDENLKDYTNRLRDEVRCISTAQASDFHWIRKTGNQSVHGEVLAAADTAHAGVSTAKRLALQFRADLDGRSGIGIEGEDGGQTDDEPEMPETPELKSRAWGRGGLLWIALIGGLVLTALAFYLLQPPAPWPKTYEVTPGVGNSSANVRSGGSGEYRVVRSLPRGALVVGVGDVLDRNSARWIKLSDGSGFMKASVLQQANTASSQASPYMNSIAPELIRSWAVQLLIVATCAALLYWFKVRFSSIVFLAAVTFALIHYGPEIRAWWRANGLFNTLSTLAPNIGPTALTQVAASSDDDFDCNPSHHCRLNFDGDNESAPIAIVDRYGRGAGVSFCPGVPIWVDEHPLVILHGWYRGSDLGTISITRAYAEAALAAGHAPTQTDHVALRRTNSSIESIDYWFTRNSRC